ncbi:hypothetical protein AB4084_30950, partial [Lysobacter sp. 2RAB21]
YVGGRTELYSSGFDAGGLAAKAEILKSLRNEEGIPKCPVLRRGVLRELFCVKSECVYLVGELKEGRVCESE